MLVGCSDAAPASVLTVRAREFSTREWDDALGGDSGFDASALEGLSDLGAEAPAAIAVAKAVAVAETSGVGRDTHEAYFVDAQPAGCSGVNVVAASAFSLGTLGGVQYAKALVAWHGSCAVPVVNPSIMPLYLSYQNGKWQPEAPGTLPQVAETPLSGDIPQWSLKELECSNGAKARIEVALAWQQMCQAAAADGVKLHVTSGWRSVAEQQSRFEGAVEFYGSREEAKRHVAVSERAACASRHCAGEALDVTMDPTAAAWLHDVRACRRADGSVVEVTQCRDGERAVLRLETYGFSEPLATSPGHLEYTLALNDLSEGSCADSPSSQVATMIVEVFRCGLRELGVVSPTTLRQALLVAECASRWKPSAKMLDGRYAQTAHPVSGRFYAGEGLFGLTQRQVSKLVAGGEVSDGWANALAAARLYVAEVRSGRNGWGPFVCATGDAAVPGVLATASWPSWMAMYVPEGD
jgi:hypothetical protein